MKKILVIDDEVEIREIYQDFLLESLGREDLHFAQDGIEAFVSCSKENFDLIILDHKMPRLTGLQFLLLLRNTFGPNQHTPVIFVSGHFPESFDVNQFKNTHSMGKPVEFRKFESHVKSALKVSAI